MKQSRKNKFFYLFTFIILFLSFSFNVFKIADPTYNRFDRGDEGYVLGRIIMSELDGLFSHGGLPGNYVYYRYLPDENGNPVTTELWEAAEGEQENLRNLSNSMVQAQMYDDYINGRKIEDGWQDIYKTQPCMMGNIYGALHLILPFNNNYKLLFFRFINLILTTLAFILIVVWVNRNYGLKVGFGVFILLLLSTWFMRFSHNLWWALWSFYIPFITMLFVLDKKKKNPDNISDGKVLLYLLLAVFLKFVFTGAEFITSTAVMAVCPIIYYCIEQKMELKKGFSFFLKASGVTILGVLLGFALLMIQIKLYQGTWGSGVEHLIHSFTKRSVTGDSLEGNGLLDILWLYLKEGAPFSWYFFPHIKFGFGVFILMVSATAFGVWKLSRNLSIEFKNRNLALVVTTFISLAGPLSWIVVFMQHAYTHQAFDYITWYMPFGIYAYIVLSLFVVSLIERVRFKRLTTQ